jgi:hypothetical protein
MEPPDVSFGRDSISGPGLFLLGPDTSTDGLSWTSVSFRLAARDRSLIYVNKYQRSASPVLSDSYNQNLTIS